MQVASDRTLACLPDPLEKAETGVSARRFHAALRLEVVGGRSGLSPRELTELRGHYPVMMGPESYPPDLVATIYALRRGPAVRAILDEAGRSKAAPRVLDAGCGFGSESFLFAAAGARVVAVDRSREQIAIARRRQPYYEELFGRELDVDFAVADLEDFDPGDEPLSLTWLGSVLANLRDQERFLRRLAQATRNGGRVMVSDMNLLNPLFAFKEWRRRRGLARRSPEFARSSSFWSMFWRRDRRGARYFPAADSTADTSSAQAAESPESGQVDDAQFFWWVTLAQLLRRTGFTPGRASYSGFALPFRYAPGIGISRLSTVETFLARVPLLSRGGYFYLMGGVRTGGGAP